MNKRERYNVKKAWDILTNLMKTTIFKSSKIYFAVSDARKLLEEVLKNEKSNN